MQLLTCEHDEQVVKSLAWIERTSFHLRRMIPDIQEFLLTNIAGWQGKLHAGKNISVGRNVAERMARAAGVAFKVFLRRRFWGSAKLFLIADQRRIMENLRQFFARDAQREHRSVAIHHGGDGGIESVMDVKFGGEFLHPG